MSTMYYASSAGGRGTNTGCDYVAATRGICCDRHRAERNDIEVRSGRAPLFEQRQAAQAEDLRRFAEIAASDGGSSTLESYLDILRESA